MKFLKNLKEYSKNAVLVAKKNLDMQKVKLDHVCYQTTSDEDYEIALKEIRGEIDVICEIPHAGRRITVAELKKPLEVEGVMVNRIEVSEPKPKRTVTKRIFDHMAFVVSVNFTQFLEELKNNGIKITEVKQIGDHKIAKFVGDNMEIELRNKSMCALGQDISKTDAVKVPGGSEIEDLRRQLQIEKEQKLRALADYQNLQKRIEAESAIATSASDSIVLAQLLDCIDDFDRIMENMKKNGVDVSGLSLLREKMQKTVDNNGLEEIKCNVGDKFDMHMCEAVGVITVTDQKEDNTVKQIVQKGYKLKDDGKVIRATRVLVGKLN